VLVVVVVVVVGGTDPTPAVAHLSHCVIMTVCFQITQNRRLSLSFFKFHWAQPIFN
jgi:ribose/xylose/arabinose/galactoside ABC-type transport system permease subunit